MELIKLNREVDIEQNKKLFNVYKQYDELLNELIRKELPHEIVQSVNSGIVAINSFNGSEKDLSKLIKRTQTKTLKLLEKELKFVVKNHYRNTWLAIGMSVFGIPLGVALGASMGNMGLLGIGLPIGLVIGMAVGANMDKKAMEEGKQLDIELKY
jgi:hypothetical protein